MWAYNNANFGPYIFYKICVKIISAMVFYQTYLKQALINTVIAMANSEMVIPMYPIVCKANSCFSPNSTPGLSSTAK